MSESKPTAAAIRAALAVSDAVALNPKLGFRERAEIIDHETGLPELLDACKATITPIPNWDTQQHRMRLAEINGILRDALAKAEGKP